MANETLRSIYSAADETVAALDQLHRASHDRVLATRQSLDAAVGRLGESSVPFVDGMAGDGPATVPAGPATARRPVDDETPYYPLPQRTTHGGPFGPTVRAKLLAAALAKDTKW